MNDDEARKLYRLAKSVLVARSLSEVVECALQTAAELIPAFRHSVGLIDDHAQTFLIYAAQGKATPSVQSGSAMPLWAYGGDLERLRAGEVDPDDASTQHLADAGSGALAPRARRSRQGSTDPP